MSPAVRGEAHDVASHFSNVIYVKCDLNFMCRSCQICQKVTYCRRHFSLQYFEENQIEYLAEVSMPGNVNAGYVAEMGNWEGVTR